MREEEKRRREQERKREREREREGGRGGGISILSLSFFPHRHVPGGAQVWCYDSRRSESLQTACLHLPPSSWGAEGRGMGGR